MTTIMRGAEPFYYKGDRGGCLLIHGFTGTPNELRWLGQQLARDGRTVLGVRLAGHGTSEVDMNRTRWSDWYQSALDGYRRLRGECERVVVGGLSMGGMLSALLAARESVDGLFMLATPAYLRDWRLRLLRPLQPFVPYVSRQPSDMQDPQAEAQHIQYEHMPTACLMSLLDLNATMRGELGRVHAPALLVASRGDIYASPDNMQYIYEHLAATDKRMVVLERSGHSIAEDLERDSLLAQVRAFIAARASQPLMAAQTPAPTL